MSCIYRVTRAHIGEEGRTKGKCSWAIAVGARPGPARTALRGARGAPLCALCPLIHVTHRIVLVINPNTAVSIHGKKRRPRGESRDATHTLTLTHTLHTRTPYTNRSTRTHDSPAATAGPHRSHVHTPW